MQSLKYPPIIQWEVTPYCNHDCIHCYNYWRSDSTKKEDLGFNERVSEEYYLEIAKKIVDSKPVIVTITGGEPFSVFSKLKPSIDLLLKNKIYVTINSNSTMVNADIVQYVASNEIPLFVSLPSSDASVCDRITNIDGSFKLIEQKLKMLIDKGVVVRTNMVVSKLNLNCIYETAKYVKEELGLNYFCATKASLPINAKDAFYKYLLDKNDFALLLDSLDRVKNELHMIIDSSSVYPYCGLLDSHLKSFAFKRRCNAGRVSFAITATGNIKACARDSTEYGNILVNSFSDSIKKMKSWQNGDYIPEDCKKCKHLWICGGGCRIDAQTVNGSICSLDPLADLSNAERDFMCYNQDYTMKKNNKMILNKDTLCVEEENCFRISNKNSFAFVSKEFIDFIKNSEYITPEGMALRFEITIDEAIKAAAKLINKNLVLQIGDNQQEICYECSSLESSCQMCRD